MNFTFLTINQAYGLDVMWKYGDKVAQTDLAILLGGFSQKQYCGLTSLGDLDCQSWTSSSNCGWVKCAGSYCWGSYIAEAENRHVSARPALSPEEVSKLGPLKTGTINIRGLSVVKVAEYGEYPQKIADEAISKTLEKLYNAGYFWTTGKEYTFDSETDERMPFKPVCYPEYQMDGKKYIRIKGHYWAREDELSNGEKIKRGKAYWVEVSPIKWLVDVSGWMIAEKCLFSGIPFDTEGCDGDDFSSTFIKRYLDTYFAREIEPSVLEASRAGELQSSYQLSAIIEAKKKRNHQLLVNATIEARR